MAFSHANEPGLSGGAAVESAHGVDSLDPRWRTWGGEGVGAMRVRKWYMNGTHKRLRVAVRRSVRGKAALRDVHLLVGSSWFQSALMLSQVDAVRCAELLERAAAEADSRR